MKTFAQKTIRRLTERPGVRRRRAALTAVCAFVWAAAAAAQTPEDRAKKLNDDAFALMDARQYTEAALKLSESLVTLDRLAPRYFLAECYSHDVTRLRDAWSLYCAVAERAEREAKDAEGDTRGAKEDLARAAAEHAKALFATIQALHLVLSDETASLPGLQVAVDGAPVMIRELDVWRHIDVGYHSLRVWAPRRTAWELAFRIDSFCHSLTITIPGLARQQSAAALDGATFYGLAIVGGAGVVAGTIGGVLAWMRRDEAVHFDPKYYSPTAGTTKASLLRDAKTAAMISDAGFVTSGIGLAGVASQALAARGAPPRAATAVQLGPLITPHFVGGFVAIGY